ncbi:gamma-glutamyltransferase [Nostoc ellipsosporum NOK]|nr:gamma-glutamyltransferase [Nostoc ellipsosporum NOK]
MIKPVLVLLTMSTLLACNSSRKAAVPSTIDPYKYSIEKVITADKGAVVSAHPLASEAGLLILKKGGNAVDAAIATQLALAVVYPGAGNLGGGGFLVAHLQNGNELAIDYREMAPATSSRDMYIDKNGNARTDLSQDGHLASGVPGTVAGLFAAARYGKLNFKELIDPAIELAEKGFVITEREARSLNGIQKDLQQFNTRPNAFQKKETWKAGDTLVQKDLAATLRRIRDKGAAGFYEGETARLIVEEMQRGNGIISYADLKNYTARSREPHRFDYKGYGVISMPMPSSGGLLLHQMLKMIEGKNIGAMGFQSPQAVQLMIEAERRAYADRATYMGDMDFFKVPVAALTNKAYLDNRMKDFTPGKASDSKIIGPGKTPGKESEETTHLSVIDNAGNAVAVTTTLNGGYGSRVVVGGAGFFLNNEMDDFSIKPGVPNMYGAVGGEANAIAPGKRMLSSMTPTIVLQNGKPYIVTGTPGGTTIPTSIFQTIVNLVDFNLSAKEAVDKPKFHHQWLPDAVFIEKDFPAATQDALRKMGYTIDSRGDIGRVELIRVKPDGRFEAVADKRGDDAASGW